MKLKIKVYAIFQFLSFISLFTLFITMFLIAWSGYKSGNSVDSSKFWEDTFKSVLTFKNLQGVSLTASFFSYISISIWVMTWGIGLLILRVQDRNLFDTLFLIFIIFPLVSNIIALFAQLSKSQHLFTKTTFNKKLIIQEHTRAINLKKLRELTLQKEKLDARHKAALKAAGSINDDPTHVKNLEVREMQIDKDLRKIEKIVDSTSTQIEDINFKNKLKSEIKEIKSKEFDALDDSKKIDVTKEVKEKIVKKATPKKPAAKKPAVKKAPSKKVIPPKTTIKKATPKKPVAKKTTVKKEPVKKDAPKK